ncbi:hypothetical protein EKD00_09470 [Chlorobium phaeovibrioides]|uniref:hypothetical protein n=1 Tax=Chlorobium phaeovibrioides TaxID=1094 RepID=UPI000F83129C|nr:hypothetical protein [Chlorobium phaeovibrioides]RTY33396.1 hypothetical protein EKD00_09470 [Chlorobium phaeovibrioides]
MIAIYRNFFKYDARQQKSAHVIDRIQGGLTPAYREVERKDISRKIVAVQCVDDCFYLGLFGMIAADLRARDGVGVQTVFTRSLESAFGNGLKARISRSLFLTELLNRKLSVMNRVLGVGLGYASRSIGDVLFWTYDYVRAIAVIRKARNVGSIADLRIDGILIGDLVIDTYLRFKPSPSFDVTDKFVIDIMIQAFRDLRKARRYFSRSDISLYLSTYSTYVQHGVPVRAALRADVPVYVFPGYVKRLSKDDFFQSTSASGYRTAFDGLSNKTDRLCEAECGLLKRMNGEIDQALFYMRSSSYSHSSCYLTDDYKGAVIVFLHDFYDSPHCYHDMVFDDFWSWIECTIETLRGLSIKFFLKPHPNQIEQSDEAVAALKSKYPFVEFVPSEINNRDLFASEPICGVTVYGTVAHELAYMGIPTICCARHPHHSFDFCRTASSREEYVNFLSSPSVKPIDAEEMRSQALAFYYMHNIYQGEEQVEFRKKMIAAFKVSDDHLDSGDKLFDSLVEIRSSVGYSKLLSGLSQELA